MSAAPDLAKAQAQPAPYPSKLIPIISPAAAGGLTDVLARSLAEELQRGLGQTVIVENRTGASGNIGTDLVAKAEPDGHTLLLGTAGMLVINELIYSKMPFDPATAFAPIALVADMPLALTVNPKTKLSSVKGKPEMIESFAKQGADLDGNTPAEFDAFIKQERVKWGPVARQLTLKMD